MRADERGSGNDLHVFNCGEVEILEYNILRFYLVQKKKEGYTIMLLHRIWDGARLRCG